MTFSTCPDCGAEYPTYYSPPGRLDVVCDDCGYSSARAALAVPTDAASVPAATTPGDAFDE